MAESVPGKLVLKMTHLPVEKEQQPEMFKQLLDQIRFLMKRHVNFLKCFDWDVQRERLIDSFLIFSEFCEREYLGQPLLRQTTNDARRKRG